MGYWGCAPGWQPDRVLAVKGGKSVEEQIAEECARYVKELAGGEPPDAVAEAKWTAKKEK